MATDRFRRIEGVRVSTENLEGRMEMSLVEEGIRKSRDLGGRWREIFAILREQSDLRNG
jgi:hypothetical protein